MIRFSAWSASRSVDGSSSDSFTPEPIIGRVTLDEQLKFYPMDVPTATIMNGEARDITIYQY